MGLEPNINRYLDNLMLAMAEVWRVLRDDGVCFVNIGDSYWNPQGSCNSRRYGKTTKRAGRKDVTSLPLHRGNKSDNPSLRPKSLCLVPQKFAIRCQEAGWFVRSEVIFHKLNPIPESCSDRPTKAHEQVWLLTKTGRYFWDKEAVREKHNDKNRPNGFKGKDGIGERKNNQGWCGGKVSLDKHRRYNPLGRNIRSVWTMATEPHPEAHFATFPSKLVDIMIRAGSSPRACEICGAPWVRILKKDVVVCSEECEDRYTGKYYEEGRRSAGRRVLKSIAELRALGRDHDNPFPRIRTIGWRKTCKCDCAGTGRCIVLDPFVGIGTTVVMAEKHGRAGVGMDLSLEYLIDIALKKIRVPVQKMLELRF
jgi:DNA modification methylase